MLACIGSGQLLDPPIPAGPACTEVFMNESIQLIVVQGIVLV